ncbi:uncharacterized protein GGS25DRAFT_525826 [Hypoxylon fragiforme]|uniref:uncharacterized protein n=1 Tax=Hypoxylon fragiforme TaxID=63214 RepID=UPI0020C73288|nr:uncharacterized protein GGS25DRAFT_525826 [Hypoxylon fragiforme]KAI2604537.1 hypothetical protein GGS25DRAFT_525826 [Hypoxylon fragiforme]
MYGVNSLLALVLELYALDTGTRRKQDGFCPLPGKASISSRPVPPTSTSQVGTVDPNTDHAKQDIDGALSTVQQLFDYASTQAFKLFFSFDISITANITQHQALFPYDTPGIFRDWKDSLDGVFTWATTWLDASNQHVNVSSLLDEAIKKVADDAGKSYMLG